MIWSGTAAIRAQDREIAREITRLALRGSGGPQRARACADDDTSLAGRGRSLAAT